MIAEPSYRYVDCDFHTGEKFLVPDTRLQAIAEAWNLFALTQWKTDIRTFNPELGSLLDALIEEADDD